jgi:hypothetical protein
MKKQVLMLLIAVLLLLNGVSLITGVEAAAASGSTGMQLPKELNLTDEATPVYDAIDGSRLYDAAPQVVQVAGAEDGWDRKLLNDNEQVWFQIKTSTDPKWVHLQNPDFHEYDYKYVVLTGSESIYDKQSAGVRSLGTISPQAVRVIYADNGYFRIQTWMGYKWIRPKHPVVDNVNYYGQNSGGLFARLNTTSPMFAAPDAGSEVVGWLLPQDVQAKITLNSDWLYIRTWEGMRWVHTNTGYPPDLRKEDTSLTLTADTVIYEHPDKGARQLGTLGPQTVDVFERGGGWHHIHSSWLGDVWIYNAAAEIDPDTYTPPANIISKSINGDWLIQPGVIGTGWRNNPFDMTAIVMKGDKIDPTDFFAYEQPADIRFTIKNVSQDDLTLDSSVSFEIEIVRREDRGDGRKQEPVWSGKLPVLKSRFQSGTAGVFKFKWDQKDSDGKQVPFGLYEVQIKLPMTINYTKDAKDGTRTIQQQEAKSAMLTHFILRIGAS